MVFILSYRFHFHPDHRTSLIDLQISIAIKVYKGNIMMFPSIKLINLTLLVIGFISIFQTSPISGGEKDKGQSIIMDGGNLIMKDHDKKKKGDTIVIKSSSGSGCGCAKKMIPVPYPIVIPKKEVSD